MSRLFGLAALVFCVGACTLLLDTSRSQCRTDADCAAFAGTVCDTREQLCVARSLPPGPPTTPGSGGAMGAPDAGVSDAAAMPVSANCLAANKPLVTIEGEITTSATLSCDRDYLLVGTVFVTPGVVLTIQKGTIVRGDKASTGTLVVQPGGKLLAVGTADEPIVFTSAVPESARQPGDWGGVILLGRAPVNGAAGAPRPQIEGLLKGGEFGGADPSDGSGALKYVRIEYSGSKLGPNNEINGLTLGGVGSGTVLDFIQVRATTDDCFEFFGGTVSAKHLVCQNNGDDGFDWDNGYQGRLQFLFLQQDPEVADETNGFEGDNDPTGSLNEPRSNPTVFNATLCGKNLELDKQQYGMLLRRSTLGTFRNLIVSGFEAGLDLRDATTEVEITHSIFHGNLLENLAYAEVPGGSGVLADDDGGLDEQAYLLKDTRKNIMMDPALVDCFDGNAPRPYPGAALVQNAATPPEDGFFDPQAAFVGAFRDANDGWARGNWIRWGR